MARRPPYDPVYGIIALRETPESVGESGATLQYGASAPTCSDAPTCSGRIRRAQVGNPERSSGAVPWSVLDSELGSDPLRNRIATNPSGSLAFSVRTPYAS